MAVAGAKLMALIWLIEYVRVTSAAAVFSFSAAELVRLSASLPLSRLTTVGSSVVSSVKLRLADFIFPAVSVSVTTKVYAPSCVGAVYSDRLAPPLRAYVRLASSSGAFKLKDASLVILSAPAPVSVLSTTVGDVSVLSSVKLKLAVSVLPAVSVSLTTTV